MSAWVDALFASSRQARSGGVVRRSLHHVERLGALPEIIRRAHLEGFHGIETGGQVVLFCHEGELIIHC